MAKQSQVMNPNRDTPMFSVHQSRHQRNDECKVFECILEVDYLIEQLHAKIGVISRIRAVEVDDRVYKYTIEVVVPRSQ